MPEIRVPGDPVPKGRPRRARNGSFYTPKRTTDYEELVAWSWKQTRIKPLAGPVSVRLDFIMATARRVDLDNLVKSVLDGLTLGGAWADDSQVVRLEARKHLPDFRVRAPETIVTVEAV